MDADALRMLADLGIQRRDEVSAPDEIPRGRHTRQDPREQAAVAAAFEKRRAKSGKGENGVEDERAARLKAWNTETTFETDEVTGQLENRWSGQGHRAGLNRQHLNQGGSWEDFDARYGEERRMYVQEKGGKASMYAGSRPNRSGQDKFRDLPENGGNKSDRVRAPSPRRFGTVRFKPGGHRADAGAAVAPAVVNPGVEAAAALRRSVQNRVTAQPSRSSLVAAIDNLAEGKRVDSLCPSAATLRAKWSNADAATKQKAPQNTISSTPVASSASKAENLPAATPPSAVTLGAKWSNVGVAAKPKSPQNTTSSTPTIALESKTANSPTVAAPSAVSLRAKSSSVDAAQKQSAPQKAVSAPATAATKTKPDESPTATAPVVEDWIHVQRCRNLARWHAANPGEASDAYHKKYPDRVHYLKEARSELIKEALTLLKGGDDKEIASELKAHPERKWIFENAKKAKKQVEEGGDGDSDADPAFGPFVHAAKLMFKPEKISERAEALKSSSDDSTDSNSHASGSSDTEDSALTAASTPPPTRQGSLIATFFDMAGRLLGSHHTSLGAPVKATISLSSRANHYDPRQLIQAIDALAQSMMDRSQGLEGVKKADDGLWVDEQL